MGEEQKKMVSRSRREEHPRTDYGLPFSKWEILIGPSDWENYCLGRDGTERYRIHNLPISCSSPGLYELGVAATPTNEGRSVRKLDPARIIPVYLGQAENVRTRLQCYGRAGAHLDHDSSVSFSNKNESHRRQMTQTGPGLFKEIFSMGYPIVFRWTPMKSKKEAENKETELLRKYDYAWNRRGNGPCRRDDILIKLGKKVSVATPLSRVIRKLQNWKQEASGKKLVEAKTCTSEPPKEVKCTDDLAFNFRILAFKVVKYRPRLVRERCIPPEEYDICGVAKGDGSVCRNMPTEGRKRCPEHKGERSSSGNGLDISREGSATKGKSVTCGVVLEDGTLCMEFPSDGRKRCEVHRGRRVVQSELHVTPESDHGIQTHKFDRFQPKSNLDEDHHICGVVMGDGSVCRNRPVGARRRCAEHKGERVSGTGLLLGSREPRAAKEQSAVCGVTLDDGSTCMEFPAQGRKRCEYHKGMRINGTGLLRSTRTWATNVQPLVCGATLEDGSPCMKFPARGRKRCEFHKGRRIV